MKEQELEELLTKTINANEIIKKLQLQWDVYDNLNYNEFNIKERLAKNVYYAEQFRLLYIKEKHNLHKLKIMYEDHVGKLYNKLKFKDDRGLTKTEIEKYYIPVDEKVKELKQLVMKQELITFFFENIYDAFNRQGWMIKAWLSANEKLII